MTCHKCDKKGHIKKDCRSKVNGSGGNPPKNSTNELPEWVTRKPVFSYTKDFSTGTSTTRSTSDATLEIMVRAHWVFNWRMAIRSGKISKAKSHLFVFPIPLTMQ